MDEDEDRETWFQRMGLRQVVVRRGEELAGIGIEDVEHVEVAVVDTNEGHVGRGARTHALSWFGRGGEGGWCADAGQVPNGQQVGKKRALEGRERREKSGGGVRISERKQKAKEPRVDERTKGDGVVPIGAISGDFGNTARRSGASAPRRVRRRRCSKEKGTERRGRAPLLFVLDIARSP